ncbi:MAG: tetratricopeptide repeat protein [Candidatus Obscuribacterales bacterium]|nr:tetratricopeptide repeat protein [Candidatus Obscuribacterales bacterium]
MIGLRTSLYRASMRSVAMSVSLLCMVPSLALAQGAASPAGTPAAGAPAKPGQYTPNPRAVSLYNLGLTAHKQGSPESAIIFFKRACDIDPDLADAQYNLGVLYQMQKRFKEAIPRFEEVLRIKPSDPDAHFQLGIILQDTGRPAEARQHLSAIAPNNPHFQEAQRRISQLGNAPAADPGAVVQQPVQTQVQPPVQSQPPANELPSVGNFAATPSYQASPGTTPAYGAMTPQVPVNSQPVAVQQDTYKSQPATAYVPNNAQAPPPAQSGPVPNMANSSLRVIATGFSAPSGLAFDRNGSLYVANYMTNSIDRISPDGTRNTFCTGVNLRGPIGLVVDDANNLYVANYNSGTVVRVSPAGISTIVASGFKKPYYLTLDRDGNLYVSQQEDNSIVRIVLPRALGARTP